MPLDWRQVKEGLVPSDYTLQTVSKVAVPKEWRDAQGWRQGLDAKRRRAVGLKD
jgi:DNA primase